MPDLPKGLHEIVGGIAIVFDDQETHGEPAISRISAIPHGKR